MACLVAASWPLSAYARTIYGYQAWEMVESSPQRGPVFFDSENPAQPAFIADNSEDAVVYGGFYCNYHWFGQAIVKGTQSSVDGLYEIDMTTGERKLIVKGGSKLIDMTYDNSSGKIYGIRSGNQWLAEYNPETGESTLIGKAKDGNTEVYLVAIAAALDGTLYVVSTNGNLYRAAHDGALTKVGPLGVAPAFDQTMCFDYSTGTLYWVNNGDYHLYTVDTETGAATDCGAVGLRGVSSMASLFIPYINVAEGAPDRVVYISGVGTENSAELMWSNPGEGANGAELAGFDGLVVIRDGVEVATLARTASDIGAEDGFVDAPLAPGDYEYEIVPFNAAGRGGVDYYKLRVHVGKDRPGMVGGLTASQGDGSAILSWTAPTTGAAGGMFSPDDITGYRIRRGSSVVATVGADCLSYEDKTNFGTYTYTVAALSAQGEGEQARVEDVVVKPEAWIVMCNGNQAIVPGREYSFYDEGGPSGNYQNSRRYTLTVTPGEENCYAVVEFSSFCVDTYGDYLSIYNGPVADENCLIGKFAATTVPEGMKHIESSAADGSLTFLFYSDILETASGWSARIKSERLLEHDLAVGTFHAPSFAVVGKNDAYAVEITNKGRSIAKGYKVELWDGDTKVAETDGPDLAPRASDVVAIDYAHEAADNHVMSMRVVYGADVNADNNLSSVIEQSVYPAGTSFVELFASNPGQMYVVPMSFMGMESIFQIVLQASELPVEQGSELKAISFPYYACTSSYSNVPLRVWVGSTGLTDLTSGSIPASQLTEVFNGTVDVVAGTESLDIPLSGAYVSDGRNMVIMVHKQMSPTDNMGVTFKGSFCYDSDSYITRFGSHSNDTDYDPFDPDDNFGYSADKQRPDIRLVFAAAGAGIVASEVAGDAFTLTGRLLCAKSLLRVYSLQGVHEATVEAGASVALQPGVHIVATEAGAAKVVVR